MRRNLVAVRLNPSSLVLNLQLSTKFSLNRQGFCSSHRTSNAVARMQRRKISFFAKVPFYEGMSGIFIESRLFTKIAYKPIKLDVSTKSWFANRIRKYLFLKHRRLRNKYFREIKLLQIKHLHARCGSFIIFLEFWHLLPSNDVKLTASLS